MTMKAIFFKRADILGTFAANALIFTRQLALLWWLPSIFEFAHGAHVSFLTIASKMSAKK
jgi:hypothetical protein